MNTTKNLSKYTDAELLKTLKQTKTIVVTFGSFMLLAFIYLIYSAITSKNYALIAIACGTFVTLTPLVSKLSLIKKEIKSRNK